MKNAALPFPYFPDNLPKIPAPGRWDELHLYTGSRCNRACDFCCVNGEVGGSYAPWRTETLDMALALVAPGGSLKFYGGEPTLDAPNQCFALRYLRENGFRGAFTIFSNGIKARELVTILEADTLAVAVLNYSIATGRGEKPVPPAALRLLQKWATAHQDRVFLSHDFVVPVGRQEGKAATANDAPPTNCFRCWPVLTSFGDLHACPFAVEEKRSQYDLGDVADAPARFARFLEWVATDLEPQAKREGHNACAVCVSRGRTLPMAR